jgi:hypothetical protein
VIGELDHDNNLALKSIDNELYSLGHIYEIEPLTPPITLIDGKAYQFDFEGQVCQGIFSSAYNMRLFNNGDNNWREVWVTNIQLLTVEVK